MDCPGVWLHIYPRLLLSGLGTMDGGMKRDIMPIRNYPVPLLLILALFVSLLFPKIAISENEILIELIISHNQNALEESFLDGSNKGEAGILMMRPDVGKSLGMKVFIDQDFLDSKELYREADKALEAAEDALFSKEKEKVPGQHAQAVADHFLAYKKMTELADQKIKAYRSKLENEVDDRLEETLSVKVMGRLLSESLRKNSNRLRGGLGLLYNICQGVDKNSFALTPENIAFVNDVFSRFLQLTPEASLKRFDLERKEGQQNWGSPVNWKQIVGKSGGRFVHLLDATIKKHNKSKYPVDPLLFMALMRRESAFNHLAISHVGAAGLTQIMPDTGKGLGMKKIYKPEYFKDAVTMAVRERRYRVEAKATLKQITEKNSLQSAKKARKSAQRAMNYGKKKERLFARYKADMLKKRTDDRLVPNLAIEHGFRYFAGLLRSHKGDMSLALASYNAGPNAVKRYKGIPPYQETVLFRNRVLQFYSEYTEQRGKLVSE
jgi:soluble lytic murein transglycosylase-like protein